MKNLRLISTAVFSAILLLPILAIAFLQLSQAYIKASREERLEKEKLVHVVLPAKDVVWEEEGRELWVGDRMFDVASFTIVDGKYKLVGVFDDDETEVAGSLLHILFSGNGNNLLKYLLLLQCFSATTLLLLVVRNWRQTSDRIFFYQFQLAFFPHLVLGPPPRWSIYS